MAIRRQSSMAARSYWVGVLIALTWVLASGAGITDVPRHEGWVTDTASVLSPSDRSRLSGILDRYYQETHHQLAVLTIPTLSGEPIQAFSLRVANAWGLGQKGVDNGILVTLAMKERTVRIELGRGMQRYISDAMAQTIVNDAMIPAFRQGDFASGLERGLHQLMEKARRYEARGAHVE